MQVVDASKFELVSDTNNENQILPHYTQYPQYRMFYKKPAKKKFRRFLLTINYKEGFDFEIFPPYAVGAVTSTLIFMVVFPSLAFLFLPLYATIIAGIAMEYVEFNELKLYEEE